MKEQILKQIEGLSKDEALQKIDLLIWENDMKELSYDFKLANVLSEIRRELLYETTQL